MSKPKLMISRMDRVVHAAKLRDIPHVLQRAGRPRIGPLIALFPKGTNVL